MADEPPTQGGEPAAQGSEDSGVSRSPEDPNAALRRSLADLAWVAQRTSLLARQWRSFDPPLAQFWTDETTWALRQYDELLDELHGLLPVEDEDEYEGPPWPP